MADLSPLRAIRYDPAVVSLGSVLAPPYDVISPTQQTDLYARDLRNIVRIDFGQDMPDDQPGVQDRYTRAAGHLEAWLRLGVVARDRSPGYYVSEHHYPMPDGTPAVRRGLFGRVRALPWEESDLRPHEHTLRGPKEDRLALMRATRAQTSAVFGVWANAPNLAAILDRVAGGEAVAGGRTDGEVGSEKHLLWIVDQPDDVEAIHAALTPARLYIADGHHRYETSVAYARERAAAGDDPDAESQFTLVYLSAADDPGLSLLPTHRLLTPRKGAAYSLDDLWMRLGDRWELEPTQDLDSAVQAAGRLREARHAFAVRSREGAAVLSRPRDPATDPRRALDVVVLQEEVLGPAGADADAIREGALTYTRSLSRVSKAVGSGEAVLAFCLNPATTAEMMAVADAGEVMPQKSTYFYPKVPTGLILSPV